MNKDVFVDLNMLPKDKRNTVIWDKCVGLQVPFKCYEIEGKFDILDYDKNKRTLTIKYSDKKEKNINTSVFSKCGFVKYVGYRQKVNWKYDIGDHIVDEKRDLTITDRKEIYKYNAYIRYYKYKCNKCGFDCNEHYRNQEYQNEMWIMEDHLIKYNCACCTNKIVSVGINDIPTVAPWLVKYFQDGYDDAKMYTYGSDKEIYPICPECNKIKKKQIKIRDIYNTHSIGCECCDGKSYPNKFSYALLEQLPIDNWEIEYNPDWLKPYLYDNYFEYNGQKYVLEMDGLLGHGNIDYSTRKKDIKGKEIDKYKDILAKEHDIKVIRVDCIKSDLEYIRTNIIKSDLNCIFNLNCVDWYKCDKFALKNIIKEVCIFWEENNHINYSVIKDKFKIKSSATIKKYLEQGTKYGWCNYSLNFNSDKRKKKVNVYDTNNNYLGTFNSITELCNKSYELFKVQFNISEVSKVCNKKKRYKTHKGHIFEWAE